MANALNIELQGKHVVLRKETLKPEFHGLTDRIVEVMGGFGTSPETRGTALMVEFVVDGVKTRYEGFDVERLATDDEVADARREREARGV